MIISKQNSFIKEVRSLKDKKFRDKLNLYVAEGVKLVNEAIKLGLPIKKILGTDKALEKIDFIAQSDIIESVSEQVFSYISDEVSPQGVLAIIEKPSQTLNAPKGSCILLDGVSDPTNVGAIIRTAIASDYKEIYLTDDSADPFSPKAVRSSMGGIFRAKIVRSDLNSLLATIDKPILIGDMDGQDVFSFKMNGEFCLCVGNEGHGVSEITIKHAKAKVKIPMQNGMESLNVAVSAGILMYALKNNN